MKASEAGIKEGSTVQLKSGGPFMTVVEIYNDEKWVTCWFFDKNEHKVEVNFPAVSIKTVTLL